MLQILRETARDARFAVRSLRKDLRFFVFATLILGLGIGACTAVFSVMSPLLLQPLPFHEPERLVWIANSGTGGMSAVTSRTSNLRDFRELSRSFDGLTGYNAFFIEDSSNLVGQGEPERLVGAGVAPDFLEVLGVEPLVGRNFVPEEGVWRGPRAVILSHSFWTRRYAADEALVGTAINLDGEPTTVVGVLPAAFDFSSLFAPQTRVDYLKVFPISDETDRWGNTISMIGRLKPEATVASAQADLDLVIDGLSKADPKRWGLGAVVSGLQEQIARPFRSGFLLLAAAAAAVMLIVCVNLSNLLLAKGPKRAREMAIRSALGAPKARLIRGLVLESLFLALGGALIGVAFAVAVTRLVATSSSIEIPLLSDVSIDGSALLFAVAVALLAGLGVGILPALRAAGGREAATMSSSSRGSSTSRGGTRLLEGLVVSEIALACVLLVAGALLLESFRRVLDVDLGFEAAETYVWQVGTARDFESLAEANVFYDELVHNVQAIPGVESAGLTDAAPLGRNRTWGIKAPGLTYGENNHNNLVAFPHLVDRRYLETMQVPLVAGRHFTADDTRESEGVIILNQSAARAVYKGEDALGRMVNAGGSDLRVIGIVADVRHLSLEKGSGHEMYFPITQNGDFRTLDMVVRSKLPIESLAGTVARAMRSVDPAMPTGDYQALGAVVDRSVSPRRFTLMILGAFAATALLLAALGIYGVLSYSVSERTPEIGIRMALGETGSGVLSRVVRRTLLLAGIGVALGALGSLATSRVLSALLFGVRATDPLAFASMAALLLGVAALAGFFPARRASRTDPARVLRSA